MSSEHRRLAGRYVLESPIGRGGMGEVWRATDTVLGREVAVKTIDLRNLHDESGAARFEREARATAGLSHPGVVTVHDSGVEDDTAYIVMELLPGPTLADRIADGPVPVDEVVEVGRQVASALDAAHARGLVHRDIKPANIAYAADGRVRVLDFGIAQLADVTGSQALTATHTVMGTADYLSPEQALGGRVDGRADLYALGCVLYALLAGRAPFRGSSPLATMMMHANDPVPDVRDLRPDTPDWLADVVHGLLAKEPDDRPAGAATVAAALAARQSLGGAATTVLPAAVAATTQRLDAVPPPVPLSAPTREPEPRGRNALAWVLGLVAVAALALLAAMVFDGRGEGAATVPTPTLSTSAPAETTEAPPTTQAPTQEPTQAPTPTPTTEAPTPTATPTPTADPTEAVSTALSAFSDEVGALQREGLLDQDTAKKLDDIVRDIDKALRDDDPQKVSTETDKLVEEYGKAVQEGTITPEAAQRLDPLLRDLTDAVDGYAA
ncbi:MAG TPA: serine/threonine-protein kinase [Ornithinibacter sp.]|nr:serine/threonine-protein kinase [Ornithinibacter sp.]